MVYLQNKTKTSHWEGEKYFSNWGFTCKELSQENHSMGYTSPLHSEGWGYETRENPARPGQATERYSVPGVKVGAGGDTPKVWEEPGAGGGSQEVVGEGRKLHT